MCKTVEKKPIKNALRSTLSPSSPLYAIDSWDIVTGNALWSLFQNTVGKIVCEVLSFSADGALCFGIPAVLGSLIYFSRLCGLTGIAMGCYEEGCWDMLGAASVSAFVETVCKLFFSRVRPRYALQSSVMSLPCDEFSFPSGHTMRAFYWVYYMSSNRFFALVRPFLFSLGRGGVGPLFVWASAVGVARIGKGRHYPLDILAGGLVGSLTGYLTESYLSGPGRGVAKTVAGLYIAQTFFSFLIFPSIAKLLTKRKMDVVRVLFYAVFFPLFFVTLPTSWEKLGMQTMSGEYGKDGFEICTRTF